MRLSTDLAEMLRTRQVSYVGTSVASAEAWHVRKKYEGIVRDVFGDGVRIKRGQIFRFRDTVARTRSVRAAGWRPGGAARARPAPQILRGHADELAFLIELKSDKPAKGEVPSV